ncbi:MAG: hypothetical protein FJ009_12975 [Chloroflexi bacterium]|nr:hypothetical protein [Chloroflexota bacterium]
MPKKTRKMKQRAALRRSVEPQSQEHAVESEGASTRGSVAPTRVLLSSARPVTPLTFDYTHIYNDLKRIALFAGFFFIVLIVLSFVIK